MAKVSILQAIITISPYTQSADRKPDKQCSFSQIYLQHRDQVLV